MSLYPLLWSYISSCYGRSISYTLFTCTIFTGSLKFTIGAKAKNFWFLQELKVNKGLCADPNNPCSVGPVFVPLTGLCFRLVDAVPSGKTIVPGMYFP